MKVKGRVKVSGKVKGGVKVRERWLRAVAGAWVRMTGEG
jgi:hypothetical protein